MCNFWHTRPRVQRAPGIPCALDFRGRQKNLHHSGEIAPRECLHSSSPVLTGRPSIPEAEVIEPREPGGLDPPGKPGADRCGASYGSVLQHGPYYYLIP